MPDAEQIRQYLLGGKTVTVRPMSRRDATLEVEFNRRLSPRSHHYRFLAGIGKLSPDILKRLSEIDGDASLAFVATVAREDGGPDIEIGVSRYTPTENPGVREIAVTVANEWQALGLSSLLTRHLFDYARQHDVRELYSMDVADNQAMRELAADLGMSTHSDPQDVHQVIYSKSL